MHSPEDAWLVWGLDHPGLGLSGLWSPRPQDVWVGETKQSAACTHDVNRLMVADLSEWMTGPELPPAPEALWQYLLPKLDTVYAMFDRTDWGREAGFTERRNHAALLVRAFYALATGRRWRFAFFAAPPHFGFDELLKEVLVWAGVPVVYGFQSLFPNRLWLLQSDYTLLKPATALPPVALPAVDTEVLFYMLKVSAKTYGAYRVPLAWLKYALGLGRSGRQSYYEVKRVLRQRRFQQDMVKAFPPSRQLSAEQFRQYDRPFAYFAMHLQPEMTTSALGEDGYDSQARVVEDVLQALPEGWSLLLKENPKQDWRQRSPAFFARISRDPRVLWLDRRIPGKEVIARARAVLTISGTAGWEAARMGKPVVLMGRAWYAGFSGIHRWDAGLSLTALNPPQSDALKRDFDARMALCFPGVVDASYLSLSACDSGDNGRQLLAILDALPGPASGAGF